MSSWRISEAFGIWFAATEIRCQEKSKGGLSYEVILAEPSITSSVQITKRPTTPGKKELSAEEIEEKLKAAEERRLVRLHNILHSTKKNIT